MANGRSVRLALAPEKPRAAATTVLRIKAQAAEPFAKPLSVRRIGETENTVRDIVPLHSATPVGWAPSQSIVGKSSLYVVEFRVPTAKVSECTTLQS
jgi:hypothetical protein